MQTYEAVLFDFGGVFTPSPFVILMEAASSFGVPVETVLLTCFGSYDQDTDHPWHRLERGEMTAVDALAAIAVLAGDSGYAIDPVAVLSNGMSATNLIREDVVDLVRQIRGSGRKTALVTNNIKEFGAQWRALLALDELFDTVVDSCEVGVRKPDRRIYELTLDQLGAIAPARAVFLDDAPGNVAAARGLGLYAIEVGVDHLPAMTELTRLLDL